MANLILQIYSFAEHKKGTTVNVGLVNGGTARNTVAARARCVVDVRVPTREEAKRIESEMLHLKPVAEETSITVTGGLHRPPMERTPEIAALVEQVRTLANRIDIELPEVHAAGGSDANLTAAIGAATVDGMGAIGANAHAEGEYVVAEELVRRTALFAHVVSSL
jgi:glutamate carboxypeptidase